MEEDLLHFALEVQCDVGILGDSVQQKNVKQITIDGVNAVTA